jgi:prepilin-type N-terminal cleavage/methylation domain-containing protein
MIFSQKRPHRTGNQFGFTLVELMVVAGIAGILMSMSAIQFEAWQEKSKNSLRFLDMSKIKSLAETYRREFGSYPNTGSNWRGSNPDDFHYAGSGGYMPGINPDLLPRDVAEGVAYCITVPSETVYRPAYYYRSTATDYKIMSSCASKYYKEYADPVRTVSGVTWAIAISTPGGASW